jgi:uncharacterized membrane protein (DUF106 family)
MNIENIEKTMQDHEGRLCSAETEIGNLKEDVRVLGSIEIAITKLTTLMEVQTVSIGDIHNEIKETKNEIKETKKDVSELKEQVNNQAIENIKANSIDMRSILKDIFMKVILPTGAIISVGAWLLKIFNII